MKSKFNRAMRLLLQGMAMVLAGLVATANADPSDPTCAAWTKFVAIWPVIHYGFPGFVSAACVAGGALMAKKDHIGGGIAVITIGVLAGLIILAFLNAVSGPVTTTNMCS